MRSHVQVVEMNFLHRVAALSLRKAKELRNLLWKWCVNFQLEPVEVVWAFDQYGRLPLVVYKSN